MSARLQLTTRRRVLDALFLIATAGSALVGLLLVSGVFLVVLSEGLPAMSWEFLSSEMRRGGEEGGILYQILGTGILALSAALIAMPLSLGLALFRSEYLSNPRAQRAVSFGLYLLNGVPSIVFGVVGYFVLVKAAGLEKSWLCGGVVLALMIVPTITVSVGDAIARVPRGERNAALALGLNSPKVIWALVLPRSLSGLVTGTLLGLARAAGETAPIMFTAAIFSGTTIPNGVVDNPVLALHYHILNLAQDASSPAVMQNAWGSALVLLLLALILSSSAWLLRSEEPRA